MAPQNGPLSFGDEEGRAGGWWEGRERDGGGDGEERGGNPNEGNEKGNANSMGGDDNNSRPPIPNPQISDSSTSIILPPTLTTTSSSSSSTILSSSPSTSTVSSSTSSGVISSTDNTTTNSYTSSSISDTTITSYTSISTPFSTTTSQITTPESSGTSILPQLTTSTTMSASTTISTAPSNTGAGLTSIPSKTSTHHPLTSASIAGLVIGTLAILTLIIAALWYFLHRKKNNKQHRKSIGGFDSMKWNGTAMVENDMEHPTPPHQGKTKPSTAVQRILTWSTIRSLTHNRTTSSISQTSSTSSQEPLKTPFIEKNIPVSHPQNGNAIARRDERNQNDKEGTDEDIVEFGDSIRDRDQRRHREKSALSGAIGGPGSGSVDWRYSVRIIGGGNNL